MLKILQNILNLVSNYIIIIIISRISKKFLTWNWILVDKRRLFVHLVSIKDFISPSFFYPTSLCPIDELEFFFHFPPKMYPRDEGPPGTSCTFVAGQCRIKSLAFSTGQCFGAHLIPDDDDRPLRWFLDTPPQSKAFFFTNDFLSGTGTSRT